MKIRLPVLMVGLAVQGLCGAAYAQNSVTLYGLVDITMDISNQGHGTLARELSGGMAGSRWGLKGSEDLGGGWKSIFTIESGFGANNGASQQGGLLFGRQAFVGVSGAPGTLTFGRQYSPEFYAFADNDAFNLGMAGGLSNIWMTSSNQTVTSVTNAYIVTSRTNNSAVYTSPNIYGVTLRAMYAFGGVAGSVRDGSTASVAAEFARGPVTFNAGYLRNVDAEGTGDLIAYTIGGSYTLGSARVFAAYTRDTDTTESAIKNPKVQFGLANLGLTYQITPFLQALAQVTKIINTSDNLPESQNAYVESVGLIYSLSKRTLLYSTYAQVQNKHGSTYSLGGALWAGGPATPDSTGRTFQLGFRTLF
jgi:predicted porin